MSGHSHWHSIKYMKTAADAKKGKIFSKISRQISIAAKEKGGDPNANPSLRTAVEKAKEYNMPKDSIERAIQKGTGQLPGEKLESIVLEAYGLAGIAIIIEGITDNRNRTIGEIRQILSQNNGKLVGGGGVQWLFERKIKGPGVLGWKAKQEIEVAKKDKEDCQKLFEALDENEAVQEIYSNIKI